MNEEHGPDYSKQIFNRSEDVADAVVFLIKTIPIRKKMIVSAKFLMFLLPFYPGLLKVPNLKSSATFKSVDYNYSCVRREIQQKMKLFLAEQLSYCWCSYRLFSYIDEGARVIHIANY